VLEEVDLDMDKEDVKSPISPCRSRPSSSSYLKRPLALASQPPSPHWETSWYKRWEVLIELVRLDTERERAQQTGLEPSPPPRSLAVRPPRFFIGEEEEDESDDSWSEDRWDEVLTGNVDDVMVVSNQVLLEGV